MSTNDSLSKIFAELTTQSVVSKREVRRCDDLQALDGRASEYCIVALGPIVRESESQTRNETPTFGWRMERVGKTMVTESALSGATKIATQSGPLQDDLGNRFACLRCVAGATCP